MQPRALKPSWRRNWVWYILLIATYFSIYHFESHIYALIFMICTLTIGITFEHETGKKYFLYQKAAHVRNHIDRYLPPTMNWLLTGGLAQIFIKSAMANIEREREDYPNELKAKLEQILRFYKKDTIISDLENVKSSIAKLQLTDLADATKAEERFDYYKEYTVFLADEAIKLCGGEHGDCRCDRDNFEQDPFEPTHFWDMELANTIDAENYAKHQKPDLSRIITKLTYLQENFLEPEQDYVLKRIGIAIELLRQDDEYISDIAWRLNNLQEEVIEWSNDTIEDAENTLRGKLKETSN